MAARGVAEALVAMADGSASDGASVVEIAGPREESLVEIARLFVSRRGDPLPIEEGSNAADPDHELLENGGLLPGPGATLAGPTFEEWLDGQS